MSAIVAYSQTDIKVEVHRVVEEGEQFNITFIIEGENSVSDFSWTPSEEFQLLWGPQSGKSSSVQIVHIYICAPGRFCRKTHHPFRYCKGEEDGNIIPSGADRSRGRTKTAVPASDFAVPAASGTQSAGRQDR